jgi:hypothetical protein
MPKLGYFLVALFIWCLPTLVLWGIVLATIPHFGAVDYNEGWTFAILSAFFLVTLIWFPVLLLSAVIGHFTVFGILVWVYYVGASGLLGFWRFSHRKRC